MMKQWLAMGLTLIMLVCLTGCGGTSPVQDDVQDTGTQDSAQLDLSQITTYEELLAMLDEMNGPSFEATYTLYNTDDLINFMTAVNEKQAVEYINTLNELDVSGQTVEVTYTVRSDGVSHALECAYVQNGETVKEEFVIAQFGMRQLASAVANQEEFAQRMSLLDLDTMWGQYPYHMIYGIYEICAITENNEIFVFDYYIDETVDEQLAQYGY